MIPVDLKQLEEKLKRIKVNHMMSKFAITISQDAFISDLAHLLMRFKISGVPVLDKNKSIVGIVTATDLLECMKKTITAIENKTEPENSQCVFVKDIMTKNATTVSEYVSLYDIIKLMIEKNIHTLPVVSENGTVGIIGRRDVINAFYIDEAKSN